MADHNDPNAVNSIFSDIDVSAADLYDMFGYPSDDTDGGEKVLIALTFAAVPQTGVFDTDMLYRISVSPQPRAWRGTDDWSFDALIGLRLARSRTATSPGSTRRRSGCRSTQSQRATVTLHRLPGRRRRHGRGHQRANREIETPGGHRIKAFLGGRDDAFFNDLPGFFRSINYAPQFYHVPQAMTQVRELPIPKTLLELEGNHLFNYDPALPDGTAAA